MRDVAGRADLVSGVLGAVLLREAGGTRHVRLVAAHAEHRGVRLLAPSGPWGQRRARRAGRGRPRSELPRGRRPSPRRPRRRGSRGRPPVPRTRPGGRGRRRARRPDSGRSDRSPPGSAADRSTTKTRMPATNSKATRARCSVCPKSRFIPAPSGHALPPSTRTSEARSGQGPRSDRSVQKLSRRAKSRTAHGGPGQTDHARRSGCRVGPSLSSTSSCHWASQPDRRPDPLFPVLGSARNAQGAPAPLTPREAGA